MKKITHLHDPKDCDPFTASQARVASRLSKVFGYTPGMADFFAERLGTLTPSLQPAFREYWETGALDSTLEAGPLRLVDLVAKYDDVLQAFLLLDSMHKNPRETTARLARAKDHTPNPNLEEHVTYAPFSPPKIPRW